MDDKCVLGSYIHGGCFASISLIYLCVWNAETKDKGLFREYIYCFRRK